MKAPAFQFYPTDWLGSQRVQMFSLEEEGAYIRLLCFCWQHGSIPSDPAAVARLIGKGASTTLATVVLAMFQPAEEGRMVHDRLEAEIAKHAVWREKSAAGGRKSAEIRKGGSTTVQPPLEGCLPNGANQTPTLRLLSSSPSSSPIPNQEQDIPSRAAARVFVPPSPEEVEAYSKTIAYPLNGQAWCDSYAQKGWTVGKSKMKDWKAAVRNWKSNGWKPDNKGAPARINIVELEPRFNQF